METMLVRLKPYDPKKGCLLRRFTYAGIKFQPEHGWHRVEKKVADYLKTVHQNALDVHSPLAFDVLTVEEARALDAKEQQPTKRSATNAVPISPARPTGATGATTTADLPKDVPPSQDNNDEHGRQKRKG